MLLESHKNHIIKKAQLFIGQLLINTQQPGIWLTCIKSLFDEATYLVISTNLDYQSMLPLIEINRRYLTCPKLFLSELNNIEPIQVKAELYLVEVIQFFILQLNKLLEGLITTYKISANESLLTYRLSNPLLETITEHSDHKETTSETIKFNEQSPVLPVAQSCSPPNIHLSTEIEISRTDSQQEVYSKVTHKLTDNNKVSSPYNSTERQKESFARSVLPMVIIQNYPSSSQKVAHKLTNSKSNNSIFQNNLKRQRNAMHHIDNSFPKKAKALPEANNCLSLWPNNPLAQLSDESIESLNAFLKQWHCEQVDFTKQQDQLNQQACSRYLRKVKRFITAIEDQQPQEIDCEKANNLLIRLNKLFENYSEMPTTHILKNNRPNDFINCLSKIGEILMAIHNSYEQKMVPMYRAYN